MQKFQAVTANSVFVLGHDGRLWLEHAPFDHGTMWEAGGVQAFQGSGAAEFLYWAAMAGCGLNQARSRRPHGN